MPIYKVTEKILESVKSPFAGVIFDCDGVLIDASKSYDLTVEVCARAFGTLLGVSFQSDELYHALELIRELGTFNNDWDSVAVFAAYLFSKSDSRKRFLATSRLIPLSTRLQAFESEYLRSSEKLETVGFKELVDLLRRSPTGTTRDDLISKLILDKSILEQFYECISYPAPPGKGLLSTFFEEAMYGKRVFKETYGYDCSTSSVSVPGNIENERVLVSPTTLSALSGICSNNLGIITGRPRVPTIYTLGGLYEKFFPNLSICLFTGENLLDVEQVKPSPKPMYRVAASLPDKRSPVLYVGDSEEDLLMVQRANASKLLTNPILFAAIAPNKRKSEFFDKSEVDCIVSEVNELPGALLNNSLWATEIA